MTGKLMCRNVLDVTNVCDISVLFRGKKNGRKSFALLVLLG